MRAQVPHMVAVVSQVMLTFCTLALEVLVGVGPFWAGVHQDSTRMYLSLSY